MKKGAGLLGGLFFLAFLGGCVSEKSLHEALQQVERERNKNDELQQEMMRLKEDFSGFSEEKTNLESRIDELLAKTETQVREIKALSKKKRVIRIKEVKKPDMAWAKKLAADFQKTFRDEIKKGKIKVKRTDDRLIIRVADSLVFEEDDLEISLDGEEILTRMGQILMKAKDHEILIGAHLDNRPIPVALAPEFPTAWEFTGTRSTEVLRFFQEESKISGKKLSAVAYGSSRPITTNATETGRSENRRIELVLLP